MANPIVTGLGIVLMLVILGAVLGAVERREKFSFVAGVLLVLAGSGLVGATGLPEIWGGIIALLGIVAILLSTVPLLRQSPTTA